MKRISTIITVSMLLLANPLAGNAQTHLKQAFKNFTKAQGVTIRKELSVSKDPETNKKNSQCDIYRFNLHKSDKKLIDDVIEAFEQDRDEAYSIAMGDGRKPTPEEKKWWEKYNTAQPSIALTVGDGSARSVGLGYEGNEYIYSLFLDPEDTDKRYRYAYAMEWKTTNDSISGKLVVTYAVRQEKMPKKRIFNIYGKNLDEQMDGLDDILSQMIGQDETEKVREAIEKAKREKVQKVKAEAAAKAKAKAKRKTND